VTRGAGPVGTKAGEADSSPNTGRTNRCVSRIQGESLSQSSD